MLFWMLLPMCGRRGNRTRRLCASIFVQCIRLEYWPPGMKKPPALHSGDGRLSLKSINVSSITASLHSECAWEPIFLRIDCTLENSASGGSRTLMRRMSHHFIFVRHFSPCGSESQASLASWAPDNAKTGDPANLNSYEIESFGTSLGARGPHGLPYGGKAF